jgi:exocyst complex component 2
MALEVIKLYISLLSTFFTLSDPSISSKANEEVPSFVPPGTTVLAACHFAEKLVEDVNEGIGELMGVDIGQEAGNGLRNMLDSLKWRMQEVISALWARGTLHFCQLCEDWANGRFKEPTFLRRLATDPQSNRNNSIPRVNEHIPTSDPDVLAKDWDQD